jgi:uncharacterized protein YeaO (DUF488 family)
MMPFQIKRVYAEKSEADGKRILVDRLWPRGVSKEKAALFAWMKDVAPSDALRKWFNHEPEKFDDFRHAYQKELHTDALKQKDVERLLSLAKEETVTLLYGAKDPQINQAAVLKDYLEARE